MKIYQYLLEKVGLTPAQVVMLVMYECQRQYIVSLLQQEGLPVQANTICVVANVDSFQGQEWEVVILSCVCSSSGNQLPTTVGFLSKPNHPNVAITRARSGLIVLGNPYALMVDSFWRYFLLLFAWD